MATPPEAPPHSHELDASLPSPRVPLEVVDHILTLALTPAPAAPVTSSFASIASFALASTDFRQIALRRYFHDITLETRKQWTASFDLLTAQEKNGGLTWIRALCASSKILAYKPTRLASLTHLKTLSIDLAQEGLSTQHPRLSALFVHLEPTANTLNMTSLSLSSLPRIDVLLLRLIARTFPRLVDLYLSCTERLDFDCCWSCFEDSLGCTVHSPIPYDYFDTTQLADAFASALKPLACLTHLHLGVFLSDDQLLYSHIAHSLGDEENMGMADGAGQCAVCDGAVEDARMRELAASVVIAQRLKAICSVGWSSFFSGPPRRRNENDECHSEGSSACEEDDAGTDAEAENYMKTTVWVLRTDGRIRVRRTPW